MTRDSLYQYIIGLTHAVHFLNEYVRRIQIILAIQHH